MTLARKSRYPLSMPPIGANLSGGAFHEGAISRQAGAFATFLVTMAEAGKLGKRLRSEWMSALWGT